MVATSKIETVRLLNNTIKFRIGVTKTDQAGSKNTNHPFHVYSITKNHVIWPPLAFEKHLSVIHAFFRMTVQSLKDLTNMIVSTVYSGKSFYIKTKKTCLHDLALVQHTLGHTLFKREQLITWHQAPQHFLSLFVFVLGLGEDAWSAQPLCEV